MYLDPPADISRIDEIDRLGGKSEKSKKEAREQAGYSRQ